MNKCSQTGRIDDYLMDRLSGSERDAFEEHFFNCDACFRELNGRQAILDAVRAHGARIFAGAPARPKPFLARFWPYATAAAAVLLAVFIALGPGRPGGEPLALNAPTDDTVRGEAVDLVAPLGTLAGPPAALEWKPLAAAGDYSVTLTGPGLTWSGQAHGGRVDLPEEIRGKMAAGLEYRWKVRAFAPQGGLTGASREGIFRIAR